MIEVLDGSECQRSFAVAALGLLLQSGSPGSDQGKFGGNKECIQRDQRDNCSEAEPDR